MTDTSEPRDPRRETTPRTPTFFKVPAGTPARQCASPSCAATIYWIVTTRGRRMPIDCDVEGGVRPSRKHDPRQLDAFNAPANCDGRGRSHFETCKDAARFRGD